MTDNDNLKNLPEHQQIEIIENTERKNFTFQEMSDIIDVIQPKLKEQALQRKKAGKPSSDSDEGRVDEKISHYLGISRDKYRKVVDIKEAIKENPKTFDDIPQRIEDGMSVEFAHKMICNTIRQTTPTPDLPDDEFELIYVDPPWKYDLELSGSVDYKTMTLDELKQEFPTVPASDDCIMFMWATNPKLLDALALLKYWGFEYKTKMAWVKFKEGKLQSTTGYYVYGADEMLLIATKGSPGTPVVKHKPKSVVLEEKNSKKHSEKPKIFYEIIEKMYPAKKKLEMFSRNKRAGWIMWGDGV